MELYSTEKCVVSVSSLYLVVERNKVKELTLNYCLGVLKKRTVRWQFFVIYERNIYILMLTSEIFLVPSTLLYHIFRG